MKSIIRKSNKQEEMEYCKQFVDCLNAKFKGKTFLYKGHVQELRGEDFPDCEIIENDKNLGVEITKIMFEWHEHEIENLKNIRMRVSEKLENSIFKDYSFRLQPYPFDDHKVSNLRQIEIDDIAREFKKFIEARKKQILETENRVYFQSGDYKDYKTLNKFFEFIDVDKNCSNLCWKISPKCPQIVANIMFCNGSEIISTVKECIARKKHKGPTDILLVCLSQFGFAYHIKQIKKIFDADETISEKFGQIWLMDDLSINNKERNIYQIK